MHKSIHLARPYLPLFFGCKEGSACQNEHENKKKDMMHNPLSNMWLLCKKKERFGSTDLLRLSVSYIRCRCIIQAIPPSAAYTPPCLRYRSYIHPRSMMRSLSFDSLAPPFKSEKKRFFCFAHVFCSAFLSISTTSTYYFAFTNFFLQKVTSKF